MYEDDLRIDEDALDVEWLDQPSLMQKYIRVTAEADKVLDEAKEALEYCEAELEMGIRADPESYGVEKVTDKSVKSAILIQEEHQELSKAVIQAKFEAKIASGAVKSTEQRKTALENLVKLHGQGYFAGPSVPRDLSFEAKNKKKQKDSDSNIKIKRKKKD